MRIYDLYISKARHELKVVLLHIWCVNGKTIGGFMNIPLAELSHINLRHKNITIMYLGTPRQNHLFESQSTYFYYRDETELVCLPTQLERTLQLYW